MVVLKNHWRVFGASVRGKSHLDKGLPCQDAHAQAVACDTLVAIVCDGAGSARHSEQGAQFVATQTVLALAERLRLGASLHDLQAGALKATLVQIRAALDELASAAGASLDDYATTVVGVVMGPDDGFFFHLGDGLGVAQLADGNQLISLPANGEYANETYFLSGERWSEQLRLLPISQPARGVVLMSDGCMPFAMSKNNAGLYAPFMDAVQGYLRTVDSVSVGNEALSATLADPRTHQITGDDKTLLLAMRT
jgi:Protein phosphatase 2C